MLTIIIATLVVSILFNLFVIVFGTKDVEALKAKIARGDSYLKEISKGLTEALGEKGATALKVLLVLLAVVMLITHLVTAIGILVAVAVGTWAAKRIYKIPAAQNLLNKVATYVNRMR